MTPFGDQSDIFWCTNVSLQDKGQAGPLTILKDSDSLNAQLLSYNTAHGIFR